MGYVGGARRFASPDQPNEKSFLLSVFGYRYLELNLLDFQLICEANLSTIIFPQRCFRTLIKCCVIYKSFGNFIGFLIIFLSKPKYLFLNDLIEESKENPIASNSYQVELNAFSKSVRFCNKYFPLPLRQKRRQFLYYLRLNEYGTVVTINYFVIKKVELPK